MPNTVIRSDALTAEISPLGAELQRLTTAAGEDLQWDGDPAVWRGRAPILFPVIGMLRDGRYRLDGKTYELGKHGFARRSTFSPARSDEASAAFRLEASDATRAAYPFDFALEVAFSLEGAALTVAATIENHGDGDMPASFGFHPALRWPLPFGRAREDHRVVFDREEPAPMRRIDSDGLLRPEPQPSAIEGRTLAPKDALFEDDAMIFDHVASRRVVFGAPGAPGIAVEFDDLPVLGVWTKPGAGYLCIEPWDGLPDPEGYDGDLRDKPGMFTVAAGASKRLAIRLSLVGEADR